MAEKSILEQAEAIAKQQAEDTFEAAVTEEGAEATLNKRLGRGWSVVAWLRQKWGGTRESGVGVQKRWFR